MWFQILCVNRGPVVHNGIVWTTTTMRQQGGTMPHAPSTARKRVLYYDVLNVVACFGVVAMHFNGLVYAYSPTFDWFQALFVDCFFYWAVPVFFMLTGATLLGYRDKYDTKTFFSKRLRRVAVPFLAWSLIALVSTPRSSTSTGSSSRCLRSISACPRSQSFARSARRCGTSP